MNKKLKPLTIFLSDDELVNFKSHFDEFLNMNCDDKIKEQQEEIGRLKKELEIEKDISDGLVETIDIAREYIQDRYDGEVLTHTFDKDNVGELLEILDKVSDKE